MSGYTRQSVAQIQNGEVVEAAPINAEFNALQGAFNGSSGHIHDGTTGNGPKINLTTSLTGVLPVAHGGYAAIHKIDATSAPSSSNDSSEGYGPGSHWVDVTNDFVWVCVDATPLSAVWRRLTQTITGTANQVTVTNGDGTSGEPTISMASNFLPVGVILPYGGSTAPTNWLLAYGQEISRSTYAALFAVFGTTYGSGNGSTTFNLPDLRGRVVAGKDDMGGSDAARLSGVYSTSATTLGGSLGAASITLTTSHLPAHDHTFSGTSASNGAHTHTYSGSSTTDAGGSHTHSVSASGTTSGESTTHTHTFSGTTSGVSVVHNHSLTLYNAGSSFNFPVGVSGGTPVASAPTSTESDNHTHTYSGTTGGQSVNHTHTVTVSGTAASNGSHTHTFAWSGTTASNGAHTHTYSGTTSSVGSGSAHNNAQPTFILNYIVKVA